MKKTLLCLCSFLWACLAASPRQEDWRSQRRDLEIPMRDGASLAADVYLPPRAGKYPCVLIQTPYDKNNLARAFTEAHADGGEVGRGAFSDAAVFVDRDRYAYVVVDWRGFHGSRDAMKGVRRGRWKRGHDGYDAVEWCAGQAWCDGKVGTWGGSALGKQQFDTAAEQPPHLVCCVPLIAAMGQGYDFYFPGGVPLEAHLKTLDLLGYDVSRKVRKAPLPDAPIWKLAERLTYRPEKIAVPCLVISGWWDHYPDQVIRTFEDICGRGGPAAREGSKLLMGPWDHVGVGVRGQGDLEFGGAALESGRAAKAFFDHHLRGADNGWPKEPCARYWQCFGDPDGEGSWAAAEKWSAVPRQTQEFHLHQGRIQTEPAIMEDAVLYRYKPRRPSPTLGGANLPPLPHGPTKQNELLPRKDQILYRSETLEEALELNGNAELSFPFSCNRVDCDFTARLCDESPGGDVFLVADAAARAKLRNGKVELLEPGKKYAVALRFPAHAYTFRKGHRLLLILSSGNHPRYERNTHTGADRWNGKEALDLEVTVHHGGGTPALLRIPRRARD